MTPRKASSSRTRCRRLDRSAKPSGIAASIRFIPLTTIVSREVSPPREGDSRPFMKTSPAAGLWRINPSTLPSGPPHWTPSQPPPQQSDPTHVDRAPVVSLEIPALNPIRAALSAGEQTAG
ncbi:hypothetical protein M569_05229 [Genlisea aurea]|uniref:Uncharacterized protein n=1 Tax=Genlisea aurea TaxID=192259 RepID=S8CX42_9LAMI|nr:hypothetical protein M569_05229 [Genlisea aurea]